MQCPPLSFKNISNSFFCLTYRLTKELSDDAQRWAEKLAEMDKLTYRQNSKYGENLYCLWSSDRDALPNAKEVCK